MSIEKYVDIECPTCQSRYSPVRPCSHIAKTADEVLNRMDYTTKIKMVEDAYTSEEVEKLSNGTFENVENIPNQVIAIARDLQTQG